MKVHGATEAKQAAKGSPFQPSLHESDGFSLECGASPFDFLGGYTARGKTLVAVMLHSGDFTCAASRLPTAWPLPPVISNEFVVREIPDGAPPRSPHGSPDFLLSTNSAHV